MRLAVRSNARVFLDLAPIGSFSGFPVGYTGGASPISKTGASPWSSTGQRWTEVEDDAR